MWWVGFGVSWPCRGRGLSMMRGSYTVHPKDLDMPNTTFDRPDLSAFTRLDDLGLEVTGQRIEPDHAVLACRITCEDR